MKNYISTKGMTEEQWLRERKNGIGGSDCSAVLGFNKWSTPIDVWIDKTHPDMINQISNTSMDIGHAAEQAVIKPLFERYEGKKVREDNKIRIHPEYDFIRANVDGIVADYGHGPGVWEAKTILSRVLDSEDGLYPVMYFLQCQHNMMVTGHSFAWLSMWIKDRDNIVSHLIHRNDDLIKEIQEREIHFWENYVLGDECPNPVNKDDLDKIYPQSKPTKVEATPDIVEDALELERVKEEIKEKKEEKEFLEFNIKNFMKENEVLEFAGERICSHKESKSFDEEEFKKEKPDLYKRYSTAFDSKTFRKAEKPIYDLYKTKSKGKRFYMSSLDREKLIKNINNN